MKTLTDEVIDVVVGVVGRAAGKRRVMTVQDATVVVNYCKQIVHGTLVRSTWHHRRKVRRKIESPGNHLNQKKKENH